MQHTKIKNFEFLRIIFMIQIVYCHFCGHVGLYNAAHLVVEAFFIISGFLFAMTFTSGKCTFVFIKSKIFRFVPLISFCALISVVFDKILGGHFNLNMLLSDIFLYSGTGLGGVQGWGYNPPAWYISVLFWVLLFYFYLLKNLKKEQANIVISVMTFIGMLLYVNNVDGLIKEAGIHYRFVYGFGEVGIGYFVYCIYEHLLQSTPISTKNERKQFLIKVIYNFFEVVIFVFAICCVLFKRWLPGDGKMSSTIAYALLILFFALRKGMLSRWLEKDCFSLAARYVLAVFLTHWIITQYVFVVILKKYRAICMDHIFICFLFVVISSILLGVFSHNFIEKPALTWLKNNFLKKE